MFPEINYRIEFCKQTFADTITQRTIKNSRIDCNSCKETGLKLKKFNASQILFWKSVGPPEAREKHDTLSGSIKKI